MSYVCEHLETSWPADGKQASSSVQLDCAGPCKEKEVHLK